jgi:hypothetical protein
MKKTYMQVTGIAFEQKHYCKSELLTCMGTGYCNIQTGWLKEFKQKSREALLLINLIINLFAVN